MQSLQTQRTILSPLTESDFDEIIQMYLEPDSNKFVPPLQDKTIEEYQLLLQEKIQKNNRPVGHGIWVIRTIETEGFVGTVNLNTQAILQVTHLGAHLKRNAWGKGYATEVLQVLRDYALQTLKLPQIYALVDEQHHASKKMLIKIGMEYEKTIQLYGIDVEVYQLSPVLFYLDPSEKEML